MMHQQKVEMEQELQLLLDTMVERSGAGELDAGKLLATSKSTPHATPSTLPSSGNIILHETTPVCRNACSAAQRPLHLTRSTTATPCGYHLPPPGAIDTGTPADFVPTVPAALCP